MWTNSFQPDESFQTKTETQREACCRRNFRGQTLKFEYKWKWMTQQLSALYVTDSNSRIPYMCSKSLKADIENLHRHSSRLEENAIPGWSLLGRVLWLKVRWTVTTTQEISSSYTMSSFTSRTPSERIHYTVSQQNIWKCCWWVTLSSSDVWASVRVHTHQP